MTRLGIVTGLLIEARSISSAALRRPTNNAPLVFAAGGNASRAYDSACDMALQGVQGLVSFGMAGGLDPALRPGDVVVADSVRGPDETLTATHSIWRDGIATALGAQSGTVYGSDHALCATVDKQALFTTHSLRIVDMESHGVARAAHNHGLPFLIVRAVADPAAMAIPTAAQAGIGPGGERRALKVLTGLLRRPAELPAILRLARHSGAAMKALDAAAPVILENSP
ncbi:MAG: hypothetical protein HOI19_18945 [Rhodospirillaceae bacterium]|nr:hypothetical protein [Rhodospirillaceae bacterium]